MYEPFSLVLKLVVFFLFVHKISFNTVHVCKREGLIPFSVKILKVYSNFADDLQSSYTSSKQELVVTYKVCNLQAGDTEYLSPYLDMANVYLTSKA